MSAFGGIADIAQTSGIRCRRSPDRTPALQRAADRSSPIRYAVIDTLGRQRIQFDQLQRREFVTLLCGVAAAWPLKARAQQSAVAVIGFLSGVSAGSASTLVEAFRQGLAGAGYAES